MKKIAYSKAATKVLTRMQPALARRIRDGIVAYAAGEPVDAKPLAGSGLIRIRIGGHRAILADDGTVVLVTKIGARGDVYK